MFTTVIKIFQPSLKKVMLAIAIFLTVHLAPAGLISLALPNRFIGVFLPRFIRNISLVDVSCGASRCRDGTCTMDIVCRDTLTWSLPLSEILLALGIYYLLISLVLFYVSQRKSR